MAEAKPCAACCGLRGSSAGHSGRSGAELETTLHRYVALYNQRLPQSALGSKTPLQAMKDRHTFKPQLYRKQPYFPTGCDPQGSKLTFLVMV